MAISFLVGLSFLGCTFVCQPKLPLAYTSTA